MECPYCHTENRNDRELCYHCNKDISMLRLIVNKARHHYNLALEHAERHRYYEAIAELQNALDLDAQLVDARVVLGTVYARLNRPDDAREQWEKALGVSKIQEKAHKYLTEQRRLRPYSGALRRLRVILGGFAATVAICMILLVVLLWPNRPAEVLDQAWQEYRSDHLAGAKSALGHLARPMKDTALELSVQSLEYAIDRTSQEALTAVERYRREGNLPRAIEVARAHLGRRPPQRELQMFQGLLEQIRGELLDEVHQRIAEASESRGQLDRARVTALNFLDRFPGASEREGLLRDLARAEVHYATLRIGTIRDIYGANRDYESARLALRSLRTELEEFAFAQQMANLAPIREEIQSLLGRVNQEEFTSCLDAAREALAAGRLEDAATALAAARRISATVAPEALPAQVALEDTLFRVQQEHILAQLHRRAIHRDWEGVLAEAERVSTATLTRETREHVDEATRLARRARAVAAYQWLMREASRIEAGDIPTEEAGEVLARAQRVLQDLPATLYPAALDDALFAQVVAYRALGKEAEAETALERLRAARPRSRHLSSLSTLVPSDAESLPPPEG